MGGSAFRCILLVILIAAAACDEGQASDCTAMLGGQASSFSLPSTDETTGTTAISALLQHPDRFALLKRLAQDLQTARNAGGVVSPGRVREIVAASLLASGLPAPTEGAYLESSPLVRYISENVARLFSSSRARIPVISAEVVRAELTRSLRVGATGEGPPAAPAPEVTHLAAFRALTPLSLAPAGELIAELRNADVARRILALASHVRNSPRDRPRLTLMNQEDPLFEGTANHESLSVPGSFSFACHGMAGMCGVRLGNEGKTVEGHEAMTRVSPREISSLLLRNPQFANSNVVLLNGCLSGVQPRPASTPEPYFADQVFSVAHGVALHTGRVTLGWNGRLASYTDNSGQTFIWVETNDGAVMPANSAMSLFRPVDRIERGRTRREVMRETVANPAAFFAGVRFVDELPPGAPRPMRLD